MHTLPVSIFLFLVWLLVYIVLVGALVGVLAAPVKCFRVCVSAETESEAWVDVEAVHCCLCGSKEVVRAFLSSFLKSSF